MPPQWGQIISEGTSMLLCIPAFSQNVLSYTNLCFHKNDSWIWKNFTPLWPPTRKLLLPNVLYWVIWSRSSPTKSETWRKLDFRLEMVHLNRICLNCTLTQMCSGRLISAFLRNFLDFIIITVDLHKGPFKYYVSKKVGGWGMLNAYVFLHGGWVGLARCLRNQKN